MARVSLYWPDYKLLPYERELAVAEGAALLRASHVETAENCIIFHTRRPASARSLTYFKSYEVNGEALPTLQAVIERNGVPNSEAIRRQSTRYSVHGLHDYKGKFNPQIARAILNSAGLKMDAIVLDPFCGSGTTLVEAAQLGFSGVGTDVNPLATFVAGAKLRAVTLDTQELLAASSKRPLRAAALDGREDRLAYLEKWFAPAHLQVFEGLRQRLLLLTPDSRDVGLTLASNLLREFSLQEPADLRIRRRISPPSKREPLVAFREEVITLGTKLTKARLALGAVNGRAQVFTADAQSLAQNRQLAFARGRVKLAITSPPYAMALPYVDTQRLSLVWLDLVAATDLPGLQSHLIGSREFTAGGVSWTERLNSNADKLQLTPWRFCRKLALSVGGADGFRRKAVPKLLYRYLVGMRETFSQVAELLAPGARFYLVVGHNHTTLSGTRVDIDTPALLTHLVAGTPLRVDRRQELQTYKRYGLHQRNAVNREELLVLQRD
jgi:site-specific DNA-methyltransferase (cytosine-N4-specific)